MTEQLLALAGADDPLVAADIRAELDLLAGWQLDTDPPTRLEKTRAAVRRRLQLVVARAELPAIARAARDDAERDGAAPDAVGLAGRRRCRTLRRRATPTSSGRSRGSRCRRVSR